MKRFLAAAVLLALSSTTSARASFQVPDGGFEAPAIGTNTFQYNPPTSVGNPWTFAGTSGIINGTGAFGNTAAPEGSQIAFLQTNSAAPQGGGAPGTISQTFTLAAGVYTLSLSDERRAGYASPSFTISLDGLTIGGDAPISSTSFTTITTAAFSVAGGGPHTLTFTSTGPTDSTTFIDNVILNPASVPEPASMAMLGLGLLASGTFFAKKTRRNRN